MKVKSHQRIKVGDEVEWDLCPPPEKELPGSAGDGSPNRHYVLDSLFEGGTFFDPKGQLARQRAALPDIFHGLKKNLDRGRERMAALGGLPLVKVLLLVLATAAFLKKDVQLSFFMEAPMPAAVDHPPARSTILGNSLFADEERVSVYLRSYAALAQVGMEQWGIPAGLHLAMGLLQSQAGTHAYTRQGNNHFPEVFGSRGFPSTENCWKEHCELLAGLLAENRPSARDYPAWIVALDRAGYSSDPQFGERLISVVNRYRLQRFDP